MGVLVNVKGRTVTATCDDYVAGDDFIMMFLACGRGLNECAFYTGKVQHLAAVVVIST